MCVCVYIYIYIYMYINRQFYIGDLGVTCCKVKGDVVLSNINDE